ncbi:MAG TPA: cupin [Candidatus Binatia bacterium]|nr:cupin [Candidatus Binatia bacterium]
MRDEPVGGGFQPGGRGTPGSRFDVRARLEAEGLAPAAWSNGPGDRYPVHRHAYDKIIAVERGSIVFGLPTGEPIYLGVGDRLELPAGTDHDAVVGPDGVTCLEAHLGAGSLPAVRRRPAGSW